jgi:hypothetical protein
MQRTTSTPAPQQAGQQNNAPKGPTPLDPRDFKLVVGGSPKGGWPTDPTYLVDPNSPKGGW